MPAKPVSAAEERRRMASSRILGTAAVTLRMAGEADLARRVQEVADAVAAGRPLDPDLAAD